MKEKLERQSNFELLRIISMIFIILAHYSTHGGILETDFSINYAIMALIRVGGKLGVTCFVLVSAYFMTENNFKFEKIIKVGLQTVFYSCIWLLVLILAGEDIGIGAFIKSVLAPIYNIYWFVTAYIGMLLMSPILNIVIKKIIKSDFYQGGKVLFYFLVGISILPFIFIGTEVFFDNVRWFCYLYLIGAYIKYHGDKIVLLYQTNRWIKPSLILGLSIIIMWGSSICLKLLNISVLNSYTYYFYSMYSPFMLASAIALFMIFRKINLYNKAINQIAKVTFACYLIHDNMFARDFIWKKIFHVELFYYTNIFMIFGHIIIVIMTIFIVAFITEALYQPIQNKLLKIELIRRNIIK